MTTATEKTALLERLRAHRLLSTAPERELEWLAAHGEIRHFQPGDLVSHKGGPINGLHVVLKGRLSHHTDPSGTWRKVMEWKEGEITGLLPYSRATTSIGKTLIDAETETLFIAPADVAAMPIETPQITTALVHVMLDRARAFTSSDLQLEKMASLGKLAAGLAHELNNPASAATRSAQLLTAALAESDEASRALGAMRLADAEQRTLDRVRTLCLANPATSVLTPLERADREESISDWLRAHGVDEAFAAPLADTEVQLASLDELATALTGDRLTTAVRWMADACAVRALARDIERAASRVHDLVSAVKGFTYMDHATKPEPADVGKGLTDTLAVLASKARKKSASLTVDVAPDLPRVQGFGGELNQVWVNLIDNALDAIGDGGRVVVTAVREGGSVVVRVTDDGPGIPPELKARIFDPFFTTKPLGQGTGLGLDIVRRLLDRNDGTIDVESAPGRTEFRVSLPVVGETRSRLSRGFEKRPAPPSA